MEQQKYGRSYRRRCQRTGDRCGGGTAVRSAMRLPTTVVPPPLLLRCDCSRPAAPGSQQHDTTTTTTTTTTSADVPASTLEVQAIPNPTTDYFNLTVRGTDPSVWQRSGCLTRWEPWWKPISKLAYGRVLNWVTGPGYLLHRDFAEK